MAALQELGHRARRAARTRRSGPSTPSATSRTCVAVEELSWGDAGLYLAMPGPGLGGAAVMAAGTPDQKERFLSRFKGEKPVWSAMAITEPGCGSDSAAIQTTAVRDGDQWVLNGTKIFCTSGLMAGDPTKSNGFIVVWATVDRSAGRAGIKSFIVNAGTPGMTVAKCEDKMGIRASDTATLIFEDCRIPFDHILGSAEVPKTSEGFKGVDGDLRRDAPDRRRKRARRRPRGRSTSSARSSSVRTFRFATAPPCTSSRSSSATSWTWKPICKPRGSSPGAPRG